jgi:internalin A
MSTLDVSENQLTDLPDSMKSILSLRELNASFNRLGRLPDAVAELPDLCNVDASSNVLTMLPLSWQQVVLLYSRTVRREPRSLRIAAVQL